MKKIYMLLTLLAAARLGFCQSVTDASGFTFTLLEVKETPKPVTGSPRTVSPEVLSPPVQIDESVEGGGSPFISFAGSAMVVGEKDTTITITINSSEFTDCNFDVRVDSSSTAINGSDYLFTDPTPVEFTAVGGGTSQVISVTVKDDALNEVDETVILYITDLVGTCAVGSPSSYTVTINDDEGIPPVTSIADITQEDVDGTALSLGQIVSVQGIVYGVNIQEGGLGFTVIDNTGGISVFNFIGDLGYTVTQGDEVRVTGEITQFNGLTEIQPSSIQTISTGNSINAPVISGAPDESTESEFISISPVTFVDPSQWLGDGTSFNVTMTNGVNTFTVRIDDNTELASSPIPNGGGGEFLVRGIGSQFDPSSPYTQDYEIFPMFVDDIQLIEGIAANEKESIQFYPNPATDFLIVKSDALIHNILICDVNGKILRDIKSSSQIMEISVSDLPAGVYGIHLESGNGIHTGQFIKQ